MAILDKISTIKMVSNLVVLRSKYDKVYDELSYRDLEVNRLKDDVKKQYKITEELYTSIINNETNISNLSNKNNELNRKNIGLISSNARLSSENDIFKESLLKEKYFRFIWALAGFCGGIITWAGIIKYFSL